MKIRVMKSIIPSEARGVAARFREGARRIRAQAQQMRSVCSTLNSSWEGRSKMAFMDSISPQPGELEAYANWLDDRARQIENMHVDIWEEKDVPDNPRKK